MIENNRRSDEGHENDIGKGLVGAVSIVSKQVRSLPMNMTYRGIAYETLVAGIPAIATEEVGTFLGKTYKIKQPQIAYRQSAVKLVYRGIPYNR